MHALYHHRLWYNADRYLWRREMALSMNTSYLNRTPNKTARNTTNYTPEFVVLHETAGYGSLDWNLRPDVRSSYNYLITRDGTIFHYVNERAYIAWHAGVNSAARGYTGGQLNIYAIGVELEGPNNGTPITEPQWGSMIALMRYFNQTYGIPLQRAYFVGHKEAAPGYKSDPRGYSVDTLVQKLQEDVVGITPVIGVNASITLKQFTDSLVRNHAELSIPEIERVYTLLDWLDIDPAFFIGLWHLVDPEFGAGDIQSITRTPLPIEQPDGYPSTAVVHGTTWLECESFQLGCIYTIWYLKNVIAAYGATSVRDVVNHFVRYTLYTLDEAVSRVLIDMKYIRTH